MGLVGILKGIGNRNVLWFCDYNRNHGRDGRNFGIKNDQTHSQAYTNAY